MSQLNKITRTKKLSHQAQSHFMRISSRPAQLWNFRWWSLPTKTGSSLSDLYLRVSPDCPLCLRETKREVKYRPDKRAGDVAPTTRSETRRKRRRRKKRGSQRPWVKSARYNRKRSNLLLISEGRPLLHSPSRQGDSEGRTATALATSSLPRAELHQKRFIITQSAPLTLQHTHKHTHAIWFYTHDGLAVCKTQCAECGGKDLQ